MEINQEKTTIEPAGISNLNGWKEEIRAALPKVPFTARDIERFFYHVEALEQREPRTNVFAFALSSLRFAILQNEDWNAVQAHLLALFRLNPTLTIPIVESIVARKAITGDVEPSTLRKFIESNVVRLVDARRFGELTWLLYLALCVGVRVRSSFLAPLYEEQVPMLGVIISDMSAKGLLQGTLKRGLWNQSLNPDGLQTPMWLYAYETTLKGLNGTSNDKFVTDHRYFAHLFARKVEFYRSNIRDFALDDMRSRARQRWLERMALLSDFETDFELDSEEVEFDEGEFGDEELYL